MAAIYSKIIIDHSGRHVFASVKSSKKVSGNIRYLKIFSISETPLYEDFIAHD